MHRGSGGPGGSILSEGKFVYVEVYRPAGLETVHLTDRSTVGKDPASTIHLDDATASRTHAALEPYANAWCVKDLGSTNGTFVNGERIFAERALQDKDELTIGRTRIVFRSPMSESLTRTSSPNPPPITTRREHEVLVALCRPSFKGDYFTEPASIKGIASELVVTEAAVKQHLSRLYEKFGIREGEGERRIRLANEAIRTGAITLHDLRQPPPKRRRDEAADET